VLLHGNGESHAVFERQMDEFSARYRVLAVDTRGHGASPRGGAPFTLSQFADDLHEFLLERGILRAHLLGFSDGGNIAALFALRYPDMTASLILSSANLYPLGLRPDVYLQIVAGCAAARVRAPFDPKAKKKAELLGLMAAQPHIRPRELRALSMPVLVLAGTHDVILSAHTRRIARSIPGAKLLFLEGPHQLSVASPEDYNRAVLSFLASCEP
jgi:pimeloyl-ACP methyl ester carboxylesterase